MTKSDTAKRSEERRNRMVTHKSRSHDEAERWDLDYWQKQGPEARLSALVAIRADVEKVVDSRKQS